MIEVTHYKPVNKGSLLATFSIKVQKWGDFLIRDLCLFQKGAQRWVSFPSRSYEQEGKTKYFSYNAFENQETQTKFMEKVLSAIEEYAKKNVPEETPVQQSLFGEVPF